MNSKKWSWQRLAVIGVLCLAIVAAGCSGDDDDDDADTTPTTADGTMVEGSPTEGSTEAESPTGEGTETESPTEGDGSPTEGESPTEDATGSPVAGDLEGFCEAALTVNTVPEPEIDFETLPPEEIAEAVQEYAATVLLPAAQEVQATAPEEIQEQVEILIGSVEEAAETGEFPETEEVANAESEFDSFAAENCDWEQDAVTAIDYAFENVEETYDAGVHLFTLTNEGDEFHEFALVRKNDGVDLTAEELIALPEDEVFQQVTFEGVTFAAPGGEDSFTIDLEPGNYVVVCFVPVGTTSEEAEPDPNAPPHAAEGMYAEFTVE